MSAVPRSEIPATSSVDLPYVLKVDLVRGGYQQHTLDRVYLMTTNCEHKQRWVGALEHTLHQVGEEHKQLWVGALPSIYQIPTQTPRAQASLNFFS